MTNFYYTDATGQRHKINDQQLPNWVARGYISPDTPLETEGGHKGLAGQIPGLFDNVLPSDRPVPVSQPTANLFCTNCGNVVSDRSVACMSCGASPIGHKSFCRHCGVALNPNQIVCIKCGVSLAGSAGAGNYGTRGNTTDVTKRLNTLFILFLICTIVGLVFYIPSAFLNAIPEDDMDEVESMGVAFIGFLLLIPFMVSWVFEFMLLYQLWKQIPSNIARTTPGKAVGFSFIPVFNFYWWFVAFWGLCKDMNETLYRRGTSHQVSEGLGLATCIFGIVHLILAIPVSFAPPGLSIPVDILMTLAGSIILICFFKSVKDGGIILLEQGDCKHT